MNIVSLPGISPEKAPSQPLNTSIMGEAHATLSFLATGKIIPSTSAATAKPSNTSEARLAKDCEESSLQLEVEWQIPVRHLGTQTLALTRARGGSEYLGKTCVWYYRHGA